MKSSSLVARRYSKALFRMVEDSIDIAKQYYQVLENINQLFHIDKIRKILLSPVIPKDLKYEILEYIADKNQADEQLKSFLKTIVDVGRLGIFPELTKSFLDKINSVQGIIEANVSSVFTLDSADFKKLESILEICTHKKVKLNQVINPEILGGLIIRIDNNIIDLSLKSRLLSMLRSASW